MILVSAATGFLVTRSRSLHPSEGLRVRNFRGVETPVTGGEVLLAGLIVAEAMAALVSKLSPAIFRAGWGAASTELTISGTHLPTLVLALGFFALGAVDDLAGSEAAKGLRGHFRALARGKITGGVLKAGGGLALSFAISLTWRYRLGEAVLDATLISLAANLLNLLDLRPGRSAKIFLVGAIPILVSQSFGGAHFLAPSALVGAAVVWLPVDVREKGMLGDSGANMLGAVLGSAAALSLDTPAKLTILGILIILTLVSEKWSFDAIIERVPPLRWFDRLGRMP